MSLSKRRALFGYLFTLPFLLGFVFIFFSAIVLYIVLSFKYTYPSFEGMVMKNVGLDNYYNALFVESGYIDNVLSSLRDMLISCPAILLYSFFIATILNQKFKGMTAARALFFLPVIVSSGFAAMQSDDLLASSIALFSGASGSGDSPNLTKMMLDLLGTSFDKGIYDIIKQLVSQIYTIIMSSGVQIIIFLASLQTIPSSLYEASAIEGSSAWEDFWKITLPMISPMIIVNAVYTLIDKMAGSTNPIITSMYEIGVQQGKIGYSAAMGIMYFVITFAVLAILISVINKFVFYENR